MSKKITKKEHANLYSNVENEGFGYYMFQYGPDIKTICKLGFDEKELKAAIKLLSSVEEEIYKGEIYAEELNNFDE